MAYCHFFFYCPPKPQQRQRRILNQLRHQAHLHFLLFKSSMIIFAFASKRLDPSHAMGRCCGGGLNLPSCCCFLFIAPVFPLFLDLRAEPALRLYSTYLRYWFLATPLCFIFPSVAAGLTICGFNSSMTSCTQDRGEIVHPAWATRRVILGVGVLKEGCRWEDDGGVGDVVGWVKRYRKRLLSQRGCMLGSSTCGPTSGPELATGS